MRTEQLTKSFETLKKLFRGKVRVMLVRYSYVVLVAFVGCQIL